MSDDTPTTENQEVTASETDNLPANKVTIEDGEASSKTVTIEIDRARIDAKFDDIFGELRSSAQVPGFRIGKAPRRLLEKRFGKEAGEDVRNGLVSDALAAAVEENDLHILGEPDIKLDEIELPETGNLTFSVSVEVAPEFDVPEYKGIAVSEPSVEVTEERIQETTKNFLAGRGVVAPTEEPAVEGDQVVVDVTMTGDDIDETRENVEYQVAGGAAMGIPLEDLGEKLAGATNGTEIAFEATVPETHATEAWRGKDVKLAMTVKEVKRLEVPELTDELAEEFGMDSAEAFTEFIKEQLGSQLQQEQQQSKREQVTKFLLDNTEMDLPKGAAARQTAQVMQRRYVDLLYRGVPREQIDQNLELLEAQAGEQAAEDLKLGFILDKIADTEEITVEDGEINARIAEMAIRRGRRPERLRSEMASQGTLGHVEVQLREQKTIDKLLEMAEVTPAEATPAEKKPAKKTAKKAAKKTAKKTTAKKKTAKKADADE